VKAPACARSRTPSDALLPDLDIGLAVEDGLLIPDFPQPGTVIGLDPTHCLQAADVELAQIAAANVERAEVERAARPAERLQRVELKRERGQRVVGRAAPNAAGDIAEHLVDISEAEGDAVRAE
jgi:hypothetical protein